MYVKRKINAIQTKYTLINREHHLQLFRWEEGKDETSRECIAQYEVTFILVQGILPPPQLQSKNISKIPFGIKLLPNDFNRIRISLSTESGFHSRLKYSFIRETSWITNGNESTQGLRFLQLPRCRLHQLTASTPTCLSKEHLKPQSQSHSPSS